MSGAALYEDVVTYCQLGEHRSGTEDDLETADWLYRSLRRAQIDAQRHPFELEQFFLDRHRLQIGDETLESFPLWPPCATRGALSARLKYVSNPAVPPELGGCIAVVDLEPGASITRDSHNVEILASMASAGARAALAVTPHPSGELVALNALHAKRPAGIPILLIGMRARDALIAAEERGAEATLEITGEHVRNAIAYEVVGRIFRGPRTFVVTTPYSGWFRCAGERGPGVALWIAVALWAQSRETDASWVFAASSGHELGGIGIRHFLDHLAPPPERVASWLHLGAGIGTYAFAQVGNEYRSFDGERAPLQLSTND
ncbi:MAG: hypothetical protein P8Y95_07100, partial [Gammaproteobacteria bacterium]